MLPWQICVDSAEWEYLWESAGGRGEQLGAVNREESSDSDSFHSLGFDNQTLKPHDAELTGDCAAMIQPAWRAAPARLCVPWLSFSLLELRVVAAGSRAAFAAGSQLIQELVRVLVKADK